MVIAAAVELDARRHHRIQSALEGIVFHGCGNALLVGKLLVDLVVLCMRALLDAYVKPVIRRQARVEADPHREADDGRQTAVVDGWGQVDGDGVEDIEIGALACDGGRVDVDVRQVDDGELGEGEGVFWVGDGSDQVWQEVSRLWSMRRWSRICVP